MGFTSNLREFESRVANFGTKLTPEQAVLFQKKVSLEALTRVVLKTPVLTGEARGGWQLTVGAPARGVTSNDRVGNSAINAGLFALTSLPPFSIVFLTNNVPHIEVLEFGGFIPKNPGPSSDPRPGRLGRILVKDGFSIQAPEGMVSVTLAELLTIFA